ncbi:MAG: hypothetical protein GY827_00765 [Cytophagales bacterium]|nr:hypothetical protein [Cytophagales bacterium]
MKKSFLLIGALISSTLFSYAQIDTIAFSSFEEIPINESTIYVDTLDIENPHFLNNNEGQPIVNYQGQNAKQQLGFQSWFMDNRGGGLSDGDVFGVTKVKNTVGEFAHGKQGFIAEDTDGTIQVIFDTVYIEQEVADIRLDYFLKQTTYESSDHISIFVQGKINNIDSTI